MIGIITIIPMIHAIPIKINIKGMINDNDTIIREIKPTINVIEIATSRAIKNINPKSFNILHSPLDSEQIKNIDWIYIMDGYKIISELVDNSVSSKLSLNQINSTKIRQAARIAQGQDPMHSKPGHKQAATKFLKTIPEPQLKSAGLK